MALETYTNADVEWWHESGGPTVALRPGGGEVSHFCNFTNPKGLVVAVSAGMTGKKVDFQTTGESDGFWQSVQITAVH